MLFRSLGGAASTAIEKLVSPEWAPLASYAADLESVRDALFDSDAEWKRLSDLFRASQEAMMRTAEGMGPRRRGGFTFPFGPRSEPPPPPTPPPAPPPDAGADLGSQRPPWGWSAGLLVVLGVASVVVLSTRVRSLDRLK